MTPTFFVPGAAQAERRYDELKAATRSALGAVPEERRIFSLSCRHAGRDCVVEVGKPSPQDGADVLAIFDLGSRAGFSVITAADTAGLLLGRHVYSVTEFS